VLYASRRGHQVYAGAPERHPVHFLVRPHATATAIPVLPPLLLLAVAATTAAAAAVATAAAAAAAWPTETLLGVLCH
jgi:hypothetical protein